MRILFAVVIMALAGWAFTNRAEVTKMSISTDASKIDWAATKKTGYHNGIIKLKSGEVQLENNKLVGGTFVIDVTSLNATDFVDNPKENSLVKHLMGKDFLETEKFPEATFEITKVDYKDATNATLTGNFTLKGNTLPLSFPVTINSADEKRFFGFAHFSFDRTMWGVTYDPNRASKDVNIGVYLLASAPAPAK
ncbi:YceI family protein [Segetibacter sp. 3557_3]|uniref:YceI family protein n=1 Tax=Segetibacter sp. 3557_3 TaxID=2547429 RepID=UPI001404C63B|nr:YceI family protein [Segetibacter sp. 3557_3]